MTLGRDLKHLGAQLGIITVLHTLTRTLAYHPHVLCIVSGGGLSLDGQRWVSARPTYLFSVDVLRRLFRGRFMAGLCDLQRHGKLTFSPGIEQLHDATAFRAFKHALYKQKWVVYANKPSATPPRFLPISGATPTALGLRPAAYGTSMPKP